MVFFIRENNSVHYHLPLPGFHGNGTMSTTATLIAALCSFASIALLCQRKPRNTADVTGSLLWHFIQEKLFNQNQKIKLRMEICLM